MNHRHHIMTMTLKDGRRYKFCRLCDWSEVIEGKHTEVTLS